MCCHCVLCVRWRTGECGIYRTGTALSWLKNKNRRSKAVVPDVIHLSLSWQPRRSSVCRQLSPSRAPSTPLNSAEPIMMLLSQICGTSEGTSVLVVCADTLVLCRPSTAS